MTYMFNDHLGSTVKIYNHPGYTYRNGYYPFLLQLKVSECFFSFSLASGECFAGEERYSTSSTPYQFTGQRNESVIGLYDYHARFYDPAIGRFVLRSTPRPQVEGEPDTIVPGPGSPQSWDRYAYVNNNPVRYSDPSGHYVFENDPEDTRYVQNGSSNSNSNLLFSFDTKTAAEKIPVTPTKLKIHRYGF